MGSIPTGPTTAAGRLLAAVAAVVLLAQPATGEAQDAPRRDILGTATSVSGKQQELVIRDFFQDRKGGVFVDVGCAWPVKHNTTYYLEKELGWTGVSIDALPDYAEAWARERPGGRFFNYLVTDRAGGVGSFYRNQAKELSSTQRERAFRDGTLYGTEIKVLTITLTKLLDDLGIARIDLLSMDIEESEPAALAGFDIDRFRPALVAIEVGKRTRETLREYFRTHGYERVERYRKLDRRNWYLAPKSPEP